MTRLDEFDQAEWWDVARRINPEMTWEEFERDWREFVQLHNARANDQLDTFAECSCNHCL